MIVNLTPHRLNVKAHDGQTVRVIEPDGRVPRVDMQAQPDGETEIDGVYADVFHLTVGEVTGLPDPAPGTLYVVSGLVASALKGVRDDLLTPYKLVRDDAGRIIGCQAFSRL